MSSETLAFREYLEMLCIELADFKSLPIPVRMELLSGFRQQSQSPPSRHKSSPEAKAELTLLTEAKPLADETAAKGLVDGAGGCAVVKATSQTNPMKIADYSKQPLDESKVMQGSDADAAADFANYFCSYASVYHQKIMLMDHVRMKAYHTAITGNRALFEGKVVMDCGAGSGVLSIWAAQAGAARVFAVEFTDMANHARKMVAHHGLTDVVQVVAVIASIIFISLFRVVQVIQSSIEAAELPCQVDIIISEWMGYMLLRESMLDSVIRARNKWLKPGGSLFPSHATLYFSPLTFEEDRLSKQVLVLLLEKRKIPRFTHLPIHFDIFRLASTNRWQK
jgi:2-polyprenyl-3-methyl-5-hydroxy-6-metoxy-1,4-benzoquinol methylase